MDENKNWVNWTAYTPNPTISTDFNETNNTSTRNIALSKQGLYCLTCMTLISTNISVTGGDIRNSIQVIYPTNTSSYCTQLIVYSNGSASATFTKNTTYAGSMYAVYIGNYSSVTNAQYYYRANDNSTYTQTFTTQNQFINLSMTGTTRYNRSFVCTNIDNSYISNWDSGTQNYASYSCINSNGKVVVSAVAGLHGGDATGFILSSYTLVS